MGKLESGLTTTCVDVWWIHKWPFWLPLNAECGNRVEWPTPRNKHMHYYVKSEVRWVCICFLWGSYYLPKALPACWCQGVESPLVTDKILICHALWIHVTHHRRMHHPLKTHYDLVMDEPLVIDEPQLHYQGFTKVTSIVKPSIFHPFHTMKGKWGK